MHTNFPECPLHFKKIGVAWMASALILGGAAPVFAAEKPVSLVQPRALTTPAAMDKTPRSNGKTMNFSAGVGQLPWTKPYAQSLPLIAHAMGEVDGYLLTNSKTALEQAYAKGYRTFEMDFEFTSDGALVGVHDWGTYAKAVGWTKETFASFVIPDRKTFLSTKLYGYLEPLDLQGMLEFMAQHPDAWLITDTKAVDPSIVKKQFEQIVEAALYTEASLLERIIPQVYTKEMHQSVQEVYPFTSYIYTLYAAAAADDDVVRLIKETGIQTVTVPSYRAQKNLLDKLAKVSAHVCVHTINEETQAQQLKALGVKGIYTDNLMPY